MKKESKLYSVINQKCPVCHEGDMFTAPVFSKRFMEMNSTCPVCGFDLVQEPSYYFGAMYVSYAIQVAVFLIVYIILRATIDPGTWTYVVWMIVASILVLPWNFRVSRAGWVSLFFSYKKKVVE